MTGTPNLIGLCRLARHGDQIARLVDLIAKPAGKTAVFVE
jgi:hypothetical protein